MPKSKIDYSNTVIYKITCKDPNITDIYVGHTTNFVQKKSAHKVLCENLNYNNHDIKLYKTIRANGGWDNWKMTEIDVFNLKNSTEARIKENEYFEKLNANLNSVEDNNITNLKNNSDYYCIKCNYGCSSKWHFDKHNETKKHINICKSFLENAKKFECLCGKEYNTRQSLFAHKKKCVNQDNKVDYTKLDEKEIIMTLLQQNNQLQNQIIELCKDKSITNVNNVNSHNKTFNLNVFLNETCKDAMNIMDFVDSLKLQLSDLESVGKIGYVEGIANIIVKRLKQLDVHKRPVHCSDSKREVMYIKDEDKWEKENEEKNKIRKAIKRVADKNARLLLEFKKVHPDCVKASSKFSDQYNKIVVESMGGPGDNDLEKEDKIIKKIAKNVIIDKSIECIDL